MKNKRILLISPFFEPNLGGVETHLSDLCQVLVAKNHKVTVITYQPLTTPIKGRRFEKHRNLEIRRISWFNGNFFSKFEKLPPIFNFIYLTPRLMVQSFLYLRTNSDKIDVIHAYGLNASFIARILKLIFGKRIVMSTEALYNYSKTGLFTKIVRWVLAGFDKILAQSDASKDEMVAIGIDANKIDVFYHWVNQKNFKFRSKSRGKQKLGWQNQFVALYIGRLIPQKGIKVFLEVAKKTKNISFKVIGDDGPELDLVKKVASKLSNLEYLGPVAYRDLPDYYNAADVFIYPALYEEDMSRAILESLSSGTPVINTNSGSGIYHLDNTVAFITKPTPKEIQNRIEYLYNHRRLWSNMVARAPHFAKRFGPKRAQVILNAYNN